MKEKTFKKTTSSSSILKELRNSILYITHFLGIFPKLQINYFSKTSLDSYFKLTVKFLLNQCHSKNEKSRGQNM